MTRRMRIIASWAAPLILVVLAFAAGFISRPRFSVKVLYVHKRSSMAHGVDYLLVDQWTGGIRHVRSDGDKVRVIHSWPGWASLSSSYPPPLSPVTP